MRPTPRELVSAAFGLGLPAAACRYYDEALPRSPGSRAKDMCERAEVFDPGEDGVAGLTPLAATAWPSARGKASAPPFARFSRLNAPARSLCLLRFAARVTPDHARIGIPGGELLPVQDLQDSISVFISSTHLFSFAGLPAHPPPALRARGAHATLASPLSAAAAAADGGGHGVSDGT